MLLEDLPQRFRLQAGYTQFFGTKDQPHLAARSTMQVAAPAEPTALVEIEVIAIKND